MCEQEDFTNEFSYLDELRESGEINMFGAGGYLQAEFGHNRFLAKRILQQWMESFKERNNG